MRIATVLHDASPDHDGAPLFPTVALERDGALYGVAALARAFGPRYAQVADDADFHHTVVALGAATLCELDERLKAGERPSAARLLPGSFTWLPPCDMERAAFFECGGGGAGDRGDRGDSSAGPAFAIGSARAFFGHEATVPLPVPARFGEIAAVAELELEVEGALGVMLADDLWRATEAEAARAILGYTLVQGWRARGGGERAPRAAVQLGPVLVTCDEVGATDALRTQLRIEGAPLATGVLGAQRFSPAESIAWISHHVPLRAGDVIAAGRMRMPGGVSRDEGVTLRCGGRVDFAVERLGRLSGRATRGPEMLAWRRSSGRGS